MLVLHSSLGLIPWQKGMIAQTTFCGSSTPTSLYYAQSRAQLKTSVLMYNKRHKFPLLLLVPECDKTNASGCVRTCPHAHMHKHFQWDRQKPELKHWGRLCLTCMCKFIWLTENSQQVMLITPKLLYCCTWGCDDFGMCARQMVKLVQQILVSSKS